MFIMMNAARLGVGLQGLAQGEVAYQNAVSLRARPPAEPGAERKSERDPDAKADPIIVHPDVRRMLMEARAWNEAGRALCCGARCRSTSSAVRPDEAERQQADDLLGLITPGHQRLSDRQGLRGRRLRAAGFRRARLYP